MYYRLQNFVLQNIYVNKCLNAIIITLSFCFVQKYIILALIVLSVLGVVVLIVGLSVGLSAKTTTNSASSSSNAGNPV